VITPPVAVIVPTALIEQLPVKINDCPVVYPVPPFVIVNAEPVQIL
jgi:hypothetical protein